MADDTIQGLTVKVGVTDEDFTGGISKINKAMTLLQSEFKASSEGLKSFGTDAQQLGSKSEYLNNAIELQKQKVQALQEAYSKSKTECGEFANSTMSAGTKVNNAVASLAKMQNELKDVDAELAKTGTEEKKLSATEGLNKLGSGVEGAKSKISSLKSAMMGITASVAGGFGLVKFTEDAIDSGNNAYLLSQKLHLTSAEATEMNRIFTITGTDSSAFSSTMVKLDKSLEGAGKNGNATTKALSEFGISLTDSNGKLLPMNEQLEQLSEGYKKASEAGNEEAFTAEVLGNKGASLIPLLENYTSAKEEASKVKGIGIDPQQAHETEEELKVLKLQVSATGGVIAKALIPVVQEILPPLITLFQNIAIKVKENKAELDKFIESAITIGKSLSETVAPVIKDVLGFIAEHGEATKNIVIGLGGSFLVFESITKTISGITGAMALWTKATEAYAIVQKALNFVLKDNPIGLIVTAIAVVIGVLVTLYENCEGFRDLVNGIGTWLLDFFTNTLPNAFNSVVEWFKSLPAKTSALWEAVKLTFSQVVAFFQNNWKEILLFIVNPFAGGFALLYKNCDGFRNKINEFVLAIKTAFVNGWNAIANFFTTTIPSFLSSVVQWFAELPNNIMYGLGTLVGLLATWGVEVWNYFSTNVPLWINSIVQWFSQLPTNIENFLTQIITNIINWGSNMLTYATTSVVDTYNAVINWFTQLPSAIQNFLTQIITNIVAWGTNMLTQVTTDVTNTYNAIINWFSQLPSAIQNFLSQVVINITTWGSNMLTEAQTGMTNVFNGIVDVFTTLPDKMLDIGKNIVLGIKDGISNAWNNLTGWIGGLCDSFTQGVKDKFQIHSPSHIFRDEIGKMLAQGIGVGFSNEMPTINTNIGKTINGTVDIANLSSLNSLKNLDKTYSTNTNTTNYDSILSKILDKMDRLEKALDIKLDGDSIVEKTYEPMSQKLAFSASRGY